MRGHGIRGLAAELLDPRQRELDVVEEEVFRPEIARQPRWRAGAVFVDGVTGALLGQVSVTNPQPTLVNDLGCRFASTRTAGHLPAARQRPDRYGVRSAAIGRK